VLCGVCFVRHLSREYCVSGYRLHSGVCVDLVDWDVQQIDALPPPVAALTPLAVFHHMPRTGSVSSAEPPHRPIPPSTSTVAAAGTIEPHVDDRLPAPRMQSRSQTLPAPLSLTVKVPDHAEEVAQVEKAAGEEEVVEEEDSVGIEQWDDYEDLFSTEPVLATPMKATVPLLPLSVLLRLSPGSALDPSLVSNTTATSGALSVAALPAHTPPHMASQPPQPLATLFASALTSTVDGEWDGPRLSPPMLASASTAPHAPPPHIQSRPEGFRPTTVVANAPVTPERIVPLSTASTDSSVSILSPVLPRRRLSSSGAVPAAAAVPTDRRMVSTATLIHVGADMLATTASRPPLELTPAPITRLPVFPGSTLLMSPLLSAAVSGKSSAMKVPLSSGPTELIGAPASAVAASDFTATPASFPSHSQQETLSLATPAEQSVVVSVVRCPLWWWWCWFVWS
jgi:hypothetical protein